MTPKPRRFSIRLPRPLWIGLAAAVLVVGALGLGFGVRIWRQYATVQAIERLGGAVGTVHQLIPVAEKNSPASGAAGAL